MLKYFILVATVLFSTAVLAGKGIELSWDKPTTREDNSLITDLDGYNLYHSINNGDTQKTFIPSEQLGYIINDVSEGMHTFQISSVEAGLEGQLSDPVTVSISKSRPSKMVIRVTIEEF